MTYGYPSKLFVFESPIDCMSHGSLKNLREQNPYAYLDDGRLSLGGVSGRALECYLKRFTSIKEIVFCLDNDEAGRSGAEKLADKYGGKGYDVRIELPSHKDYNEMLAAELEQRKVVNG